MDCPFCWLVSMALPLSCTLSTELSADWAVETRSLTAAFGTFWAKASRLTVASPMVPSLLIWPPAPYGEVTARTWGSRATRASMAVTAAWVAGVRRVPDLVCTTIWSVSPAWDGKSAFRMSSARLESVAGNEKLFGVSRSHRSIERAEGDQGHQPDGQHDPTVVETPTCDNSHCSILLASRYGGLPTAGG